MDLPLAPRIGAVTGWYAGAGGPTAIGSCVAGTNGLGTSSDMFTWPAHQFTWTDASFQKIVMQLDFKTSTNGYFDDDRIGWMIRPSSISSDSIFGVQLDPVGTVRIAY